MLWTGLICELSLAVSITEGRRNEKYNKTYYREVIEKREKHEKRTEKRKIRDEDMSSRLHEKIRDG